MTSVAVDTGTSSVRGMRAGSFEVSKVDFAAERRLAWHAHPKACVAVVMEGAVRKRFARSSAEADVGTVVAMPPEEGHEDLFGRSGSSIVVVESRDRVERVACFKAWEALLIGMRIARELTLADEFSALAVEGLALELSAVAARTSSPPSAAPWLREARALLAERFREVPTAAGLAAEIGVHPAHLARVFRSQYGESLGGCARRLRLEWAAEQLVRTDVRLAALAVEAGFVDQSHFTRTFRQQFGMTPARYRAALR
jgi:AraC family transcriptional regulator